MTSSLPINIEALLRFRAVESSRVEFKASWDEKTTGLQVIHTVCAFANDLQNLNGGYLVIGIEAPEGTAKLSPCGVDPAEIEGMQKWIRGKCKSHIEPEPQVRFSPEVVEGRYILVLWVPGGQARPYRAAKALDSSEKLYWVRQGAETVIAKGQVLSEVMMLQRSPVPFDDRRALDHSVEEIRSSLVREFVHDIKSGLSEEPDDAEVYRSLLIVERVNGHEVPRNVGLLFFSEDPDVIFRGARIEVATFPEGTGGDVIEEVQFRGSLHRQLRDCVNYLRQHAATETRKLPDRAEAVRWSRFPLPAIEEAVANAVCHRSYENQPDPIKIHIYSDRIEITSYPGPVPGVTRQQLQQAHVPQFPARNRRIGEFLKELRLAELRGTGVPKLFRAMKENGSPPPHFDFDDERTYFTVVLPVHPATTHTTPRTGEWGAILTLLESGDPNVRRAALDAWSVLLESGSVAPIEILIAAARLAANRGAPGGEAEYIARLFIRMQQMPGISNEHRQVIASFGHKDG